MDLKKGTGVASLGIFFLVLITSGMAPGTASAQQKGEFKFDIASVLDSQHPIVLGGNMWGKLLGERTNGRVVVNVYPNSQLGGNRETMQATQNGLIQGYLDSSTLTSSFVPQLAVFDLPYLAENTEKVYKILDSPLAQEMSQLAIRAGLRPMGLWEATLRSVYSKKPINAIGDLKGLKIRVIPSPSYITVFKALGASPTPMSFGELYTALAQGTVDAAENDMVTFFTSKHYEVAKNYAITNHIFLADTLWISEKHFSKMPDDIKKIMSDAAKEVQVFVRQNRGERDKTAEEQLKAAGVKITYPDLKPFVELGRKTYPEFEEKLGKDLIKKVQDLIK
jgi:tripartite ATP-independent transporter DctP family solute receptor